MEHCALEHHLRVCILHTCIGKVDHANAITILITVADFTFWSGAHAQDGVAVLVCFALNCYHSVTTYTWYHDDNVIVGNSHLVFYAERSGKYTCIMQSVGGIEKAQDFSVLGITTILLAVPVFAYFICI